MGKTTGLKAGVAKWEGMETRSAFIKAAMFSGTAVLTGLTLLWNVLKKMADASTGMTFDSL